VSTAGVVLSDRPAARRRSLQTWITRGGTAVADQAVTSGTTLALSVLLARSLDPQAFGSFAVGMTVLLLGSTFHNALVLEPMSVLGPGRYGANLGGYLRAQIPLHFAVTVPPAIALILAGAAVALTGRRTLAEGIIGAGIALPMLLLQWLARTSRYTLGRPRDAFAGSVVASAVVLGGVLLALAAGWRTPLAGFVALAAGSAGGAWFSFRRDRPDGALPWRAIAHEHWTYGRWMVLGSGISVAGTQVQLLLAAAMIGLSGAGELRAMQIIALPASQVISAISTLVLPSLARQFGEGALTTLRRHTMAVGGALVGGAICYELVLIAGHRPLGDALYGGKFASGTSLIPIFGLVAVFQALTTCWSLALRAAQRPVHYLIAGGVTAVAGIGSAAVFASMWGLAGAAWSIVAAYAATAGVAVLLYRAWVVPRS
jgi:O-antigen/teichoic acid export membrane protein